VVADIDWQVGEVLAWRISNTPDVDATVSSLGRRPRPEKHHRLGVIDLVKSCIILSRTALSWPPYMPTAPAEGEILTIKEVAEYLKVTDRTIYRLAGAKKIPAFKVGGTWRFSRADIDEWIRRQSADPQGGGSAGKPG
jgi:excisionase family DNA binding protein